ncbi:MAG: DUF1552 domain-containing protein [Isosphaeraceae bacterium]
MMAYGRSRRDFLRDLGIGAAALPFLGNLPSLGFSGKGRNGRKQRLVIVFSPDGVVPKTFWPDEEGEIGEFKASLAPLQPLRDRVLTLHGVCDKIRGDGDNHMRGMGCLLTGAELFPGNIQGGSHTPAGWASGLSIDQAIKNAYQARPETKTRFGSLEFGVMVPERADTWTRMVYTGPNRPVTPIDDPYQMFAKLYSRSQDRENLRSVLDELNEDLKKVGAILPAEDRKLLDEQATFVREMEQELKADETADSHPVPELDPGVRRDNDNMPRISRMQIDLMVNSFAADFTRVATLQYTNSVGQAKMHWLGINEGQHDLSHNPDSDEASQEKLTKINAWYCEQLAYLAQKLADTPEPGGEGSLLDNTTIVWTNELGQGNSHTLDNIPFVMVGNGLGFSMGRALKYKKVPHNRLLLAIGHAMGVDLKTFGNPDYCGDGALTGLV